MARNHLISCCALLVSMAFAYGAQAADSKDAAAKDDGVTLVSQGIDKNWQNYMLDDAAAHVSAASLTGVAPSAVTIAESTRDFGLLVKATDPKNKGSGIAITPARASHPFPRLDGTQYLKNPLRWQPLLNLTFSYAQGVSEIDSVNYRRRAIAVSTNGTFRAEDDPVWVRVKAMDCADEAITQAAKTAAGSASGPISEDAAANQPKVVKNDTLAAKRKECLDKISTQFDERWFRPIWSATLATGDVSLDQTGATAVRLGETLVLAARYGAPIAKPQANGKPAADNQEEFEWGWALSGSVKLNRHEPVLSTVGTADVQRQSSSLVALRATAGTDTMRLLGEASNVKLRAAQGGEQTLKRALGIDYRVASGWWLNFRYGRRQKVSGTGEESAGMLTLAISPSAIDLKLK